MTFMPSIIATISVLHVAFASGSTSPVLVTAPPLANITSDMAPEPKATLSTTFSSGSEPPHTDSDVPKLPSADIDPRKYPTQDVPPPTDSTEVKQWLKELDGANIPDIDQTKDGSCLDDVEKAYNASRCWWTCGGCSRPGLDIVTCPQKMTWGLTFDDGPSEYTPKLLEFLSEKGLTATFFTIGSRVVEAPQTLQATYMQGHQIAVHTWSHPPLTSLTNAGIVAELGWSRQIIRDLLGVTPTMFRPPYGDIDDRVRAVALAMGLQPVIWTGTGADAFDTNDWRVPDGEFTGQQTLLRFEDILARAANMDTGFITLEHDLYQQTVDLAVGYTIPQALSQGGYNLTNVADCTEQPMFKELGNGSSVVFPAELPPASANPVTFLGTTTITPTPAPTAGYTTLPPTSSVAHSSVAPAGAQATSAASRTSTSMNALIYFASVLILLV